jgi:hypothetical protein
MSEIHDDRSRVRGGLADDERLARRDEVVHDDRGRLRDGRGRLRDEAATERVPRREVVRDEPAYAPEDGLAAGAQRFGGVKVGSAFFGWLTATGLAVLLTAVLAAAGTAVGLETGTDATKAADQAAGNAQTVGLVGAIAIAVVLFVSYLCGGYVAGRMARFDGARQGVAVWVWSVVVAIVVGVVGAVAGSRYDVLGQLNSFPRVPLNTQDLTTAGVVAVVLALVIALVGAVLGGIAGMRFHRRVDRAVVEPY